MSQAERERAPKADPARWEAGAGAEQSRRLPDAMREGYFSVDERSLADLVATSAGFARCLAFFNPRDMPDGDWGRWFEMDEAFVLARIAHADTTRWRAEFLAIADTLPVRLMLSPIRRVAVQIDGWLRTLGASGHPPAVAVATRIRQLITQRLAAQLNWAIAHSKAATPEDLRGLDEIWKLDSGPAVDMIAHADMQERAIMRMIFIDFIDAAEQLREAARHELQESLALDDHEPSAALFLAFLHLMQIARKPLDQFTDRLTRFYHEDCLHFAPRKAEPRSVYLVCRRAEGRLQQVIVPRGAAFALGRDATGREVIYRADDALHVTPVTVAALNMVRLERDSRTSPESELGYVTRARTLRLPVVAADAPPARRQQWWPLFGGSVPGAAVDEPRDAALGFAIASPELLLGQGAREVRLGLHFQHPADLDVEAAEIVRELADGMPEAVTVPGGHSEARSGIVQRLFSRYAAIERRFEDGHLVTGLTDEVTEAEERRVRARATPAARGGQRGGHNVHGTYSHYLLRPFLRETRGGGARVALGRLFARWMLVDGDAVGDSDVEAVREALAHDTAALSQPSELREYLFSKFVSGLFEVSLTGSDGWFSPSEVFAVWDTPAGAQERGHLSLVFRLGSNAPAVVAYDGAVHGGGWPTRLPVARVRLNPGATLFPYSLLAELVLSAIDIAVDVKGAHDAVLYNNFGRLDASKAFSPFGPLPARGSYLIFGSAEASCKNLRSLALNINWGGLPDDGGGFRDHYRGYETAFSNQAFAISTAVLRDGRWEQEAGGNDQLLFTGSADRGRVCPSSRLEVTERYLRNFYRPLPAVAQGADFRFDPAARGGFCRITLEAPADTFGHREYPQLLTRVVSANARHRRQLPLPNAPYTPLIERLTLDYRSGCSIDLVRQTVAERGTADGQVLLLHPWGFEEIYPAVQGGLKGPVPQFTHDGSLFIGLAAEEPPGRITLLFHMNDESARRRQAERQDPATAWFYLASNRWRPLAPACVVSDATHGFLTTGIVTLDLPEDISRDNTTMPSGLYWLCVGTEHQSSQFAGLFSVAAQAFCATQVEADTSLPTPAGTMAEPLGTIPGLIRVMQAGELFGGRPLETRHELGARAGERLRHKNRASVPWDYERLVLERFPNVFKVKCFAGIRGDSRMEAGGPAPGCVTVVVVPATVAGEPDEARAPQLTARELEDIRDWLEARKPPFAEICVRNAIYERVQVRCAVRFRTVVTGGQLLQRLNRELIGRLSPWRSGGAGVQFGWTLRAQEVEAWIRDLDYVEAVARVSLLQVAEDDHGLYWLGDSARAGGSGDPMWSTGTLRPRFPWGIAVSMRQHLIEHATAAMEADDPQATGVAVAAGGMASGIGIGSTFVVSGKRDG